MIDWIQGFGELLVGLAGLIFLVLLVLAGLVELYDSITGADEKKTEEQVQERLRLMREEES